MPTWVPEDQRDTSWYLFNENYMCSVPHLQTMSVEYLEFHGMPSSGDAELDRSLAGERVRRYLTIAKMTEYFQRGVTVGVTDPASTKKIYERITDHLNAWRIKLHNDFNVRAAPLEDLVMLDSFAAAVYKHARHQDRFDQRFVDSLLARHIGGTMRVNRESIMRQPAPQVSVINAREEKPEDDKPKYPEHNSMADVFLGRSSLQSGGRKWK